MFLAIAGNNYVVTYELLPTNSNKRVVKGHANACASIFLRLALCARVALFCTEWTDILNFSYDINFIIIGHFTVVCLVSWPWIGSVAGDDLVLIRQ